MSMHEHMTNEAIRVMGEHPTAWAKIMRTIGERYRNEPEFRRDLRGFSDVPSHVRNQQVEWYYAIQCYTKILIGDVGACNLKVGATPLPDAEMEDNNKILQAAFEGESIDVCAAREYDCDGSLGWSEPLKATRFVKTRRSYETVLIELAPWSAPFEVGYTHGYRSYMHLLGPETALVRWCYGEDFIRVYKMLPHAVEERGKRVDAWFNQSSRQPVNSDVVLTAVEQLTLWN